MKSVDEARNKWLLIAKYSETELNGRLNELNSFIEEIIEKEGQASYVFTKEKSDKGLYKVYIYGDDKRDILKKHSELEIRIGINVPNYIVLDDKGKPYIEFSM
jgi:hypothetical protein